MPCNCEVEGSSESSEHQNGCEKNDRRSSTGHVNGHHHSHRKLFPDDGHEDTMNGDAEQAVARETVRWLNNN